MLSAVRRMLAGCMNGVLGGPKTLVPPSRSQWLQSTKPTALSSATHACQIPHRHHQLQWPDLQHNRPWQLNAVPSKGAAAAAAANLPDKPAPPLDEDQQAASMAQGRITRVLAGPGSGKTTLLVARVLRLVQANGVAPQNIMVITFTKKAAEELKKRLSLALPARAVGSMTIGTFHSICSRLVRTNVTALESELSSSFTCCDDDDQESHVRDALEEKGGRRYTELEAQKRKEIVKSLIWSINNFKYKVACTFRMHPAQMTQYWEKAMFKFTDERRKPVWTTDQLVDIFLTYQQSLMDCDAVDFSDLLGYAVYLLREHPHVLASTQARFKHVLVDEFQDTNIPQYEFLKFVAGSHNTLFVVGDVNQCIYSWRGAAPSIMERTLELDYPDVSTYYLSRNYRSVPEVVSAAEAVLGHDGAPRLFKPLVPMRTVSGSVTHHTFPRCSDEAEWVVREIQRLIKQGVKRSEITVLYSMKRLNTRLVSSLISDGVKFKVLGERTMLDRAEVRDLVAYLRWVLNPCDAVALKRLKEKPKRGLGDATLKKLKALADSKGVNWANLLFDDIHDVWLSPEQVRNALQHVRWLAVELTAGQLLKIVSPDAPLPDIHAVLKTQGLKLTSKQAAGIDELRALLLLMKSAARYVSINDAVEVLMTAGGYYTFHKDAKEDKKHDMAFKYIDQLRDSIGRMDSLVDQLGPVSDEQLLEVVQTLLTDEPLPLQDVLSGVTPGGPAHPMQALMACLNFLMLDLSEENLLDDGSEEKDSVKLSTLHASKGLEYGVVFIIGLEQGNLPKEFDGLDEQIRLAYVGCTRAKDQLHLTTVEDRRLFGSGIMLNESEFIRSLRRKKSHAVKYKTHQGRPPAHINWR